MIKPFIWNKSDRWILKNILDLPQCIIGPSKICTGGLWSISEAPEFLMKMDPRFGLLATHGLPIVSCVFATAYIFIKTKIDTLRMVNHRYGVFFSSGLLNDSKVCQAYISNVKKKA